MHITLLLLTPFFGTTLGALSVFLLKKNVDELINQLLIGFSCGIMIASSIWSLLIPSIDISSTMGDYRIIPPVLGFVIGFIFMMVIDMVGPSTSSSINKMIFAITIHNVPEGMAVGVILAGVMSNSLDVSYLGAFGLVMGIAIQNIPEGAIVSLSLKSRGKNSISAFLTGFNSGVVEPIAGFITLVLTNLLSPLLPYILSFACGTMIYVTIHELIPEFTNNKYQNAAMVGFAVGFCLMMALDVTLG